jgi:hypothetical protein
MLVLCAFQTISSILDFSKILKNLNIFSKLSLRDACQTR